MSEEKATGSGRNPYYDGLFEGETEAQRTARLGAAVTAPADTIEPCRFEPGDTQAENELICEKLLGWRMVLPSKNAPGSSLYVPAIWQQQLTPSTGRGGMETPAFTDWHGAGMILEAMQKEDLHAQVTVHPDGYTYVRLGISKADRAETGPLAIRAAALAYLRSLGQP